MDGIISKLKNTGGETHYRTLYNTFVLMRDGFNFSRYNSDDSVYRQYIDVDNVENNTFRCVHQFDVGYGLDGEYRTSDVLLFVVCTSDGKLNKNLWVNR